MAQAVVDRPVERIVRDAGVPNLVEILAEGLSATDLQSLMLEVYRRRASHVSPSEVLARYEGNRFVAPSTMSPKRLVDFEQLLWDRLPANYEGLELSPLCPFGTNSSVATVDQNKIVTTIRTAEVVADATNVLALECARRRRSYLRDRLKRFDKVFLAASQRQVRAQPTGGPRMKAHFNIVGLCAAGRDEGSFRFEADALRQHLHLLMSIVAAVRPTWRITVAVTDMANRSHVLKDHVMDPLRSDFPHSRFQMDPDRTSGRGYYKDACFKLFVKDDEGYEREIGDGGSTDWVGKFLSDGKESLVIAGLGVDVLLS
jgi:hypothetical protein